MDIENSEGESPGKSLGKDKRMHRFAAVVANTTIYPRTSRKTATGVSIS